MARVSLGMELQDQLYEIEHLSLQILLQEHLSL